MPRWRANDVMTTDVVTATTDTSVSELADLLTEHRISAVPVVDKGGRVLGVVSQADLITKVPARPQYAGRARPGTPPRAGDLMTSPAVRVSARASLPTAARTMANSNVKRLIVTDDRGRLDGVLSRADLVRLHTRSDDTIRRDIEDRVLRRTLSMEPGQVRAAVSDGVATLTGAVGRRTTAAITVRLVSEIPGVVSVVDKLDHDFDDTKLARSRVGRTHPFSAHPFDP
ncbi:CBS domain-containing protein [Jidongwangia harbinensis]|uniref:CBS domain-containing protein n=1 Tax=Jidongwangia harbinensis TaxID=2878561 RepID=UPI001CDA4FF8|nr:CBS domain-containing protein [Jidongwangia harbinensis]MCA2218878.1 CBS domain-containing protein [Jidongwangia harbinensis]